MSVIKKLFPEYKTKAELKQEVAYYKNMVATPLPVLRVERDVLPLRASITLTEGWNVPIDYLKKELCRKFIDYIEPLVEFEVVEEDLQRLLIGTLYVADKI